jgi:hypothetical protein
VNCNQQLCIELWSVINFHLEYRTQLIRYNIYSIYIFYMFQGRSNIVLISCDHWLGEGNGLRRIAFFDNYIYNYDIDSFDVFHVSGIVLERETWLRTNEFL